MSSGSRFIWWIRGLLVVTGLSTIGIGAQNMYTSVSNLSPATMSFAEYQSKRPGEKWLKLTDAWVDFRFAVGVGPMDAMRNVEVKDYYVPVFARQDHREAVCAFLQCKDPQSLALAKEALTLKPATRDEALQMLQNYEGRMHLKKDVQGLVLFGLTLDSEVRSLLSKSAAGRLDPNFIIIDENEEPQGGYGLLLLIGGIVLLLTCAGTFFIAANIGAPRPVYTSRQTGAYPADQVLASNAYQPPPQTSIPLKNNGTATRARRADPGAGERPPWER